MRKRMAIFAHPDDESVNSGTTYHDMSHHPNIKAQPNVFSPNRVKSLLTSPCDYDEHHVLHLLL
jgi:hypothetical protein